MTTTKCSWNKFLTLAVVDTFTTQHCYRHYSMTSPVSIHKLHEMSQNGEKISVITAYDATFARLASEAAIDIILVGDSLGMVLQGHSSTLPVNVADMAYHTAAVAKGATTPFIISDMPFMSYHSEEQAMNNAALLMQA